MADRPTESRRPAGPTEDAAAWRAEVDSLFRAPESAAAPVPDWLKPEAPPGVPDWLTGLSPEAAETPAEDEPPPPVEAEPPPPPVARVVAPGTEAQLLARMGVDPATGDIVDREQFDLWYDDQRRRLDGELPPPRADDADPFRTARKQLAAWFDLAKNKDRVARGDFTGLRHDRALVAFLLHFEQYGEEKSKNLRDYLEFLLENRASASS